MASILVVDDERVIREGCKRILSADGHRVITAENGQEALDVLASERVDVILCDLKMPVMGAVEFLERVQEGDIPIIVITGQGTIRNAVECMRSGAYDFIAKPFRADVLVTVVRHAVEGLPPPSRLESLGDLDV
ncbi:MAG: response regulator [Acidobacteriota bacterium]